MRAWAEEEEGVSEGERVFFSCVFLQKKKKNKFRDQILLSPFFTCVFVAFVSLSVSFSDSLSLL